MYNNFFYLFFASSGSELFVDNLIMSMSSFS